MPSYYCRLGAAAAQFTPADTAEAAPVAAEKEDAVQRVVVVTLQVTMLSVKATVNTVSETVAQGQRRLQ